MLPGLDHDKLRTCVSRIVGDQDADDVLQTVYVKLLKDPYDPEHGAQPMTWAYTIAHQTAAAHLSSARRRSIREARYAQGDPTETPSPAEGIEMRVTVRTLLNQLSPEHQAVLLAWAEGGSILENAASLGITKRVYQYRLQQAHERLAVLTGRTNETSRA